jgi:hypothetical protein
MCFNKSVSLATYMIGVTGSLALYTYGYVPEALFYAWVVQMQLIEYFLWKNQICSDTNKNITKTGIFVNHMEPFILWLAIGLRNLPVGINVYMLLFGIWTYFINKNIKTECTLESKSHLRWKWNDNKDLYYTAFLGALVLLSLFGLGGIRGQNNAFVILLGFALSWVIYEDSKAIGAMWCFAGALFPFVLLSMNEVTSS